MMSRFSRTTARRIIGTVSLLAGLGVWEVYARTFGDPLFTPTVGSVVSALWSLIGDGDFWSSYATTLVPFLYGWSTALILGVAAGLAMGMSRAMAAIANPHLSFVNALPVSTLVPVVVIVFGIDIVARSTVVFLFAIVEVVMTTAAGVRFVDDELLEMGRAFGLNRRKRFTRIIVPGAAPGIAAAIRVGTGRAVVGMVVMELLLVSVGVGKLISRYKDRFDAPRLYAVVVSLAIFALAVQAVMRALEQRAQPWQNGT